MTNSIAAPTEPTGDGTLPAPASGAGPVAVVAAHGELAAGLVSAVAQITGRGDLLMPLSNRGLGPSEIEAALRAALDGGQVRAVFTDLQGGSCTMAARRLQRERPGMSVATGVNLATLLDFVCTVDGSASRASDAEGDQAAVMQAAVARAVERGRGALVTSAAPAPVPTGTPAGGRVSSGTAPAVPPTVAPDV